MPSVMRRTVLSISACLLLMGQGHAHQVDVFLTHRMPVNTLGFVGDHVSLHYVDQTALLNQSLTQHMAMVGTKERAINMAKAFIKVHQNAYRQAAVTLNLAEQYGITRIPTVVIDRCAQFVGTTNINSSLNRFMAKGGCDVHD